MAYLDTSALVPLGTLGALHLATLLVWRERMKQTPVLATHGGGLALAARPGPLKPRTASVGRG